MIKNGSKATYVRGQRGIKCLGTVMHQTARGGCPHRGREFSRAQPVLQQRGGVGSCVHVGNHSVSSPTIVGSLKAACPPRAVQTVLRVSASSPSRDVSTRRRMGQLWPRVSRV